MTMTAGTTEETVEEALERLGMLTTAIEPDEGKGLLSIANITGDTRIMWDPRNEDEVATARAAFNAAKKKKMLAYAVNQDGGKTGDVIRDFDPDLGKVIMTRQLAGG